MFKFVSGKLTENDSKRFGLMWNHFYVTLYFYKYYIGIERVINV